MRNFVVVMLLMGSFLLLPAPVFAATAGEGQKPLSTVSWCKKYFKFGIRDLAWGTAIVAMATNQWVLQARLNQTKLENQHLQRMVAFANLDRALAPQINAWVGEFQLLSLDDQILYLEEANKVARRSLSAGNIEVSLRSFLKEVPRNVRRDLILRWLANEKDSFYRDSYVQMAAALDREDARSGHREEMVAGLMEFFSAAEREDGRLERLKELDEYLSIQELKGLQSLKLTADQLDHIIASAIAEDVYQRKYGVRSTVPAQLLAKLQDQAAASAALGSMKLDLDKNGVANHEMTAWWVSQNKWVSTTPESLEVLVRVTAVTGNIEVFDHLMKKGVRPSELVAVMTEKDSVPLGRPIMSVAKRKVPGAEDFLELAARMSAKFEYNRFSHLNEVAEAISLEAHHYEQHVYSARRAFAAGWVAETKVRYSPELTEMASRLGVPTLLNNAEVNEIAQHLAMDTTGISDLVNRNKYYQDGDMPWTPVLTKTVEHLIRAIEQERSSAATNQKSIDDKMKALKLIQEAFPTLVPKS